MIYNPYPSIKFPFGDDNKYFFWLFEAIRRVNIKYIKYEHEASNGGIDYVLHIERVFAYELYRQWGNIINSTGEDLVLNGEIGKTLMDEAIIVSTSDDSESASNQKEKELNLYPDLVLHHSQGDDTAQIQICEIKRNKGITGSAILGDLYKLSCYLDQNKYHSEYKNPFKYGIFIIVDGTLKVILENLKLDSHVKLKDVTDYTLGNFIRDRSGFFGNIVCVSYDGTNLEYELLSELIKFIVTKSKNTKE